jgi:hypothetical protein
LTTDPYISPSSDAIARPTQNHTERYSCGRGFQHPELRITILRCGYHHTAHKYGIGDAAIVHALDNAITVVDLEPDADPPKVLAIGPDHVGNLLRSSGSNSLMEQSL